MPQCSFYFAVILFAACGCRRVMDWMRFGRSWPWSGRSSSWKRPRAAPSRRQKSIAPKHDLTARSNSANQHSRPCQGVLGLRDRSNVSCQLFRVTATQNLKFINFKVRLITLHATKQQQQSLPQLHDWMWALVCSGFSRSEGIYGSIERLRFPLEANRVDFNRPMARIHALPG